MWALCSSPETARSEVVTTTVEWFVTVMLLAPLRRGTEDNG